MRLAAWDVWRSYGGKGWWSIKITARKDAAHKANYWTGYHPGEHRWAQTRDLKLLKKNRARVFAGINAVIPMKPWRTNDDRATGHHADVRPALSGWRRRAGSFRSRPTAGP
ncbi:MAG: hypothetical protein WD382_02170 [Halofilum sp. (in: g-proteobacteria)]